MLVRNGNHAEPRLPQFRVTVNARCGRACFFCRPSGEAVATAAGMELKVDDLIAVAKVVRGAGITSIKLTGGDPALYGPLEEAVFRLRREAEFDQVEVDLPAPFDRRARRTPCGLWGYPVHHEYRHVGQAVAPRTVRRG
ncbi:MAG: radical SAM protein [Pseudonocardiaceae bacterium]